MQVQLTNVLIKSKFEKLTISASLEEFSFENLVIYRNEAKIPLTIVPQENSRGRLAIMFFRSAVIYQWQLTNNSILALIP